MQLGGTTLHDHRGVKCPVMRINSIKPRFEFDGGTRTARAISPGLRGAWKPAWPPPTLLKRVNAAAALQSSGCETSPATADSRHPVSAGAVLTAGRLRRFDPNEQPCIGDFSRFARVIAGQGRNHGFRIAAFRLGLKNLRL